MALDGLALDYWQRIKMAIDAKDIWNGKTAWEDMKYVGIFRVSYGGRKMMCF